MVEIEFKPRPIKRGSAVELIIHGAPVALKNRKHIVFVHGRRIIKTIPRLEAYQHRGIAELCQQWGRRPPITVPISLVVLSFGAWKRSSGTLPDASNLYQMPEDMLEGAGIIENDRQIESHDGSRRICMCDDCSERPYYKAGPKRGQRKPDCGAVKKCPHQRVELKITVLDEALEGLQHEGESDG